MPITEMIFSEGLFYVREVGAISKEDANVYAERLNELYEEIDDPIVILIDALDVTSVSMEAQRIFARITSNPKHDGAFIACKEIPAMQAARVIGLMSKDNKTFTFGTLEKAQFHANQRVQELRGKANI